MSYLKKINSVRRKLTKIITNNIGKSSATISGKYEQIDASSVKRILISRPNHRLGNMLLITPIVQEVGVIFPNAKVDLFVKGTVANIIFENYDNVDSVISLPKKHFKQLNQYLSGWLKLKKRKYDLVVNCIEFSSSGKLSTQFSNGTHKYFGPPILDLDFEQTEDELKHSAKKTVFGLRNFLTKSGVTIADTPIPTLNIKLSKNEIAAGKSTLQTILKNDIKTIALFTFATGTKCYSEEWWTGFYDCLQLNFPKYNFIEILPVENISMLNFLIPTFYSKDVREIGGVMANAAVFIGADSGMMHLASASQVTTIGLFSVTDVNIYGPYGNKSTAIDTNKNNYEECMKIISASLAP
jgi:ADP-heptose:LPS heptosyltransferase